MVDLLQFNCSNCRQWIVGYSGLVSVTCRLRFFVIKLFKFHKRGDYEASIGISGKGSTLWESPYEITCPNKF